MTSPRIIRIEWAILHGHRPRIAGCNARLGEHGDSIQMPLMRLSTDDGATGFGVSRASPDQARQLLGTALNDCFEVDEGVIEKWWSVEYPIWDLIGRYKRMPVYALAAATRSRSAPRALCVRCYDTSLYFDDLHLTSHQAAAELIASEALERYSDGHRAFKIKVGRGARHMPLESGTIRDIAVIRSVRQAVGASCQLMVDANNGYNLNLAKRVLEQTSDCGVYWMEEAFHEDPVLYGDLKQWLAEHKLDILVADGEGDASCHLLEWAHQGLIDVIQYDVFGYGFTRWLHIARQLDEWGIRTAPHHYGGHFGNYAACHLAPAIDHFTFVEWDTATTPGLDTSGYTIANGVVSVSATPGFGLALDNELFERAVHNGGWSLSL